MPYTHNDWVAGENKFDVKTQADVPILSNVKINNIGVAGTAINPTNLNNVEDAINSLRRAPQADGTANALTVTAYHGNASDEVKTDFVAKYDNGGQPTTVALNSGTPKYVYDAVTGAPPVFLAGERYSVWFSNADDCYYTKTGIGRPAAFVYAYRELGGAL